MLYILMIGRTLGARIITLADFIFTSSEVKKCSSQVKKLASVALLTIFGGI